jgi:hypothetical protein
MSDLNPNPEENTNSNKRGTWSLLSQIDEHTNGNSNGDERPVSPKRKSSQHIKLPERLNRPQTGLHRTLSDALRAERSREEQETLLADDEDEDADRGGCLREPGELPGSRDVVAPELHPGLNIYYNIQRIRRLVLASIEDPYTMDQLKEPRMNVLIVKPLVDRLYDEDDISIGRRRTPIRS